MVLRVKGLPNKYYIVVNKMANKFFIGELWEYLKKRKAWWMLPIVILLFLAGILIIFSQSSAVSPFIYALF